jgi:hypothetical protein
VCVSVIVSAGPSNPIVCVPGMKPARVDATSIGRGNPPAPSSLQQQRRARRRVLLRRVMRSCRNAPKSGCGANSFAACATSARTARRRSKSSGDDDPEPASRPPAQLGFARRPAGRADDEANPARRQHDGIRDHRIRCREIDGDINTGPPIGLGTAAME